MRKGKGEPGSCYKRSERTCTRHAIRVNVSNFYLLLCWRFLRAHVKWKDSAYLGGMSALARDAVTLLHTKNHETRVALWKGMALRLLREMNRVRRLDTDLLFPGKNPQSPVLFKKHWVNVFSAAQVKKISFS